LRESTLHNDLSSDHADACGGLPAESIRSEWGILLMELRKQKFEIAQHSGYFRNERCPNFIHANFCVFVFSMIADGIYRGAQGEVQFRIVGRGNGDRVTARANKRIRQTGDGVVQAGFMHNPKLFHVYYSASARARRQGTGVPGLLREAPNMKEIKRIAA
jgi:hypothetical protein